MAPVLIVPTVIQPLLAALRFFQMGSAPLVSIQSICATVTEGAEVPLLLLNSAARLLLMSARTAGNVAFCTVWSA
jgi:hypothetical protein